MAVTGMIGSVTGGWRFPTARTLFSIKYSRRTWCIKRYQSMN